MNWRKSILVRVAVLFVLLGSVTAVSMGIIAYSFAKHAIAKNMYNAHKDVVWQLSKSIDFEVQKNLALLLCTTMKISKKFLWKTMRRSMR